MFAYTPSATRRVGFATVVVAAFAAILATSQLGLWTPNLPQTDEAVSPLNGFGSAASPLPRLPEVVVTASRLPA